MQIDNAQKQERGNDNFVDTIHPLNNVHIANKIPIIDLTKDRRMNNVTHSPPQVFSIDIDILSKNRPPK